MQKLLAPVADGFAVFAGAWHCASPEAGDSEEKWSRRPDGSWTFVSSQVEGTLQEVLEHFRQKTVKGEIVLVIGGSD